MPVAGPSNKSGRMWALCARLQGPWRFGPPAGSPRGPGLGAWVLLLPQVFLVVVWVLFSEKVLALVSQ